MLPKPVSCFVVFVAVGLGFGLINVVAEALTGSPLLVSPDFADDTSEQPVHSDSSWTTPVPGSPGTPYGIAGDSWSSGHHTGVDFPVPQGTKVSAASTGSVVTAGPGGQYGTQIVIKHTGGIYTQYAHLSQTDVETGQHVSVGQDIGRTGETGNAHGPHLHFEVRTGPDYGSDIDPVAHLREQGVTLSR